MSEKRNIDKLFKEKLKEFEATPSASVWENISQQFGQESSERKGIPLWWKIAGVAAGLILLITVGTTLLNTEGDEINTEQNVVDTESVFPTVKPDNETGNSEMDLPASTDNNTEPPVSDDEASESSIANSGNTGPKDKVIKNNDASDVKSQQVVAGHSAVNQVEKPLKEFTEKNKEEGSQIVKKEDGTSDMIDSAVVDLNNPAAGDAKDKKDSVEQAEEAEGLVKDKDPLKVQQDKALAQGAELTDENPTQEKITEEAQESLEEAIAAQDESETDEKEEFGNRWSVTPQVAPVYFNSLGSGSAIDGEFSDNSRTGEINMNYGIVASYDFNEKLTLRAGINQMNLSYRTNDVIVYNNIQPNTGEKPLKNVNLNEESMDLSFLSANGLNFAQVPGVVAANIESSIDQEVGFIEFPLELEYKLTDKKVGISVIGGMSTLILSENRIYSSLQGQKRELGEASNINSTSFSANLGMGLNVKISESIDLNLEPVFKYHLNTFKDTNGNFNPYNMGIYSGLSFKF